MNRDGAPSNPYDVKSRGGANKGKKDQADLLPQEDKVVYMIDSSNEIRIKLASFDKLVEKLTTHENAVAYTEPFFLQVFLLVYRLFASPMELFHQLIRRFEFSLPPVSPHAPADQIAHAKRQQQQIRVRVCNVFKNWLSNHFYDFEKNPDLVRETVSFIHTSVAGSGMDVTSQTLLQVLDTKMRIARGEAQEKKEDPEMKTTPPKPLMTNEAFDPRNILMVPPQELARQLTLVEFEMLAAVRPVELLRQAWVGSDKAIRAPNVIAAIAHFNRISMWVAWEVVAPTSAGQRRATLEYFIRVAEECHQIQNYSTVLQMLAGLKQNAIMRLKDLWAELSARPRRTFEDLDATFVPTGNWRTARELYRARSLPLLPHLGMFLTDLVFTEGLPDRVGELINFDKHRKTAQSVKQIEFYQSMPFAFEALPAVRDFLLRMGPHTPQDISQRSYIILPREGKESARPRGSIRVGNTQKAPPQVAETVRATTTATPPQPRKLSMLLPSVASTDFALMVQAALAARFPHQPVPYQWQSPDRLSFVYGWPETIALDLIKDKDETVCVIYARSHCNRADISLLRRLCMFYKEVSQAMHQVRGVMVAMLMYEDDCKIAADFNIEVLGASKSAATSLVHSTGTSPSVPTATVVPSAVQPQMRQPTPTSPRTATSQSERAPGSVVTAMELLKQETSRAKAGSLPPDNPGVPGASPPVSHPQLAAPTPAQPTSAGASPSASSPSSPPPQPGVSAAASAAASGQPTVDAEGRVCVTTWFDFLVAADIPPDAAREYEKILLDNALEIDQLHELTLELLQSLGFRMGHLMRIMKTLECTEVVYPEGAPPAPPVADTRHANFGSRAAQAATSAASPPNGSALAGHDLRVASVAIPSSSSDALLHNIMSFGPSQQ